MKYAIMSDAHANPRALTTALEDAAKFGCRKYALLGDITGYGYDVRTTLKTATEKGEFRGKFAKRFMTPATKAESSMARSPGRTTVSRRFPAAGSGRSRRGSLSTAD